MASFFLEVERSGKSERALAERFRRYGDFYYSGRYERGFGSKALRVLFLVGAECGVSPERQIARLAATCARLGVTILRFAPLQGFVARDPGEVLFGEAWHRPGQDGLCSLFER